MSVGKNIKKRREYVGISQRELARRAGLTPAAICQIEKSQRRSSLDSFVKIAGALLIDLDELYYGKP